MKTQNQVALAIARENLASAKIVVANIRDEVAMLRAQVKADKTAAAKAREEKRTAAKAAKAAKAATLEAKRAAAVAKLEAKLAALKARQNSPKARKRASRKASPVTVVMQDGELVA